MDRRALLVLALLGVGCARTAETAIGIALPSGDTEAKATIVRLELELWAPTENACRDLIAWRAETCPRTPASTSCPAPPSPRDHGQVPTATTTSVRAADGTWPTLRLPALDQGPWDLRIRGLDAHGQAKVYGCATLAAGTGGTVELWRPWCDLAACAAQVLPACLPLVSIECPALGASGTPLCTITATATVLSWEEAGVQCPADSPRVAPCAPASVLCGADHQQVLVDGRCPRAPTCSDTSQSCVPNLEPLGCGTSCVPGAACTIGRHSCQGKVQCIDRQSSVCVFPSELCNGADDDCDGVDDAADPDALAACNVNHGGYAVADSCSLTEGCRCGGSPACVGRTTCIRGTCQRIAGGGTADAGAKEDVGTDADAGLRRDVGQRD